MNPAPPVTRTVVTAPTLSSDRPRCRATCVPRERVWRAPTHAIIAALSVHSSSGGNSTRSPGLAPVALHPLAQPRVRHHAAAQQHRARRRACRAAAIVFVTCTSTIASWKLAARSGRIDVAAGRALRLHVAEHRRLQPAHREVEVAGVAPSSAGTGSRRGSPSRAIASSAGPPGNPSPISRATLSNASPAASSSVWPEDLVAEQLGHVHEHRVAAAHDERDVRRLGRAVRRGSSPRCAPRGG